MFRLLLLIAVLNPFLLASCATAPDGSNTADDVFKRVDRPYIKGQSDDAVRMYMIQQNLLTKKNGEDEQKPNASE